MIDFTKTACCLWQHEANYPSGWISPTPLNTFSDALHMPLLQSFHESCQVLSGSNSKWPTYCHFCLLKLTKYLKMLSVRMNVSNTNKYLFLILNTCIYYNPPMNPYNLQQNILPCWGYHCFSDIFVCMCICMYMYMYICRCMYKSDTFLT